MIRLAVLGMVGTSTTDPDSAEPPRAHALPGAADAITRLRSAGIAVALMTDLPADVAEPMLDSLRWNVGPEGFVDALITPEVAGAIEEAAAPDDPVAAAAPEVAAAMAQTLVDDPHEALVAVATVPEVRAGQAAGAGLLAGVLTGDETQDSEGEELRVAPGVHILDSIAELPDLLSTAPEIAPGHTPEA